MKKGCKESPCGSILDLFLVQRLLSRHIAMLGIHSCEKSVVEQQSKGDSSFLVWKEWYVDCFYDKYNIFQPLVFLLLDTPKLFRMCFSFLTFILFCCFC